MKKGLLAVIFILPMVAIAQKMELEVQGATVDFNFVSDNTAGTLSDVESTISLDVADLSNATITGSVKVSTLNTGNKGRDKHLKSGDFFDIEKYPTMSFTSTSVTEVDGAYQAKGTLTIKGVEKEVTFGIINTGAVLKFKTTIYSADFGIMDKKKREKTKVTIEVKVPVK
ncbi:MAG: polyisoprenoid-binding protein YceI [Crocinitomicaceae bacterium]|jgi:polyisoprenoid-binding protein YceI